MTDDFMDRRVNSAVAPAPAEVGQVIHGARFDYHGALNVEERTITRVTPKRIYFMRPGFLAGLHEEIYVDRATAEAYARAGLVGRGYFRERALALETLARILAVEAARARDAMVAAQERRKLVLAAALEREGVAS